MWQDVMELAGSLAGKRCRAVQWPLAGAIERWFSALAPGLVVVESERGPGARQPGTGARLGKGIPSIFFFKFPARCR